MRPEPVAAGTANDRTTLSRVVRTLLREDRVSARAKATDQIRVMEGSHIAVVTIFAIIVANPDAIANIDVTVVVGLPTIVVGSVQRTAILGQAQDATIWHISPR